MQKSEEQKKLLSRLFASALRAVSASQCLPAHLPQLGDEGRVWVIGAGKGAAAMAQVVEQHYGDRIAGGIVVTRYQHGARCERIKVIEAAHPVPDDAGEQAARQVMESLQGLTEQDTVLCLMTGGASSLLALPAEGLTLQDKQHINRALLKSGADIHEMNCVRKHLSAIKGGRLAQACLPASLQTYVISDVPGDEPGTVGSGPSVENFSTPEDAISILKRYGIQISPAVAAHLQSERAKTPIFSEQQRHKNSVHVVATARDALEAAKQEALQAGYAVWLMSDAIEGEARDIAKMHGALALEIQKGCGPVKPPCILLSGGETTVTVKGKGRGGRNAEFLLSLAQTIKGSAGICALACDTDGIDGVENNAGAILTQAVIEKAQAQGLNYLTFLDDNNAYEFFERCDGLIVTGPTLTNVNDFRAIVIEPLPQT